MAPRSARKRKNASEGEAMAPTPTPIRRRKREEDQQAADAGAAPTKPHEDGNGHKEGEQEPLLDVQESPSLSFDPEESQMLLDALGATPTRADPEDYTTHMLETQYEDDEEHDEDVPSLPMEDEAQDELTMNGDEEASGILQVDEYGGHEQQEEHDGRASLTLATTSIEEILQQLADVASNFLSEYRELTSEGEMIQQELDKLNDKQEARCDGMMERLQRAGNSIFSFGQTQEDDADGGAGIEATIAATGASQEMAVQ